MTSKDIREHPILFSGPMVRAILSGEKTQTRRVVTSRNSMPGCCPQSWDASERWRCRWVVGERLWVRETWWQRPDDGVIVFDADGAISFDRTSLAYRMGIANVPCGGDRDHARYGFRKRSSIHMPRWVSRIILDIVNVRVQRLTDISEEDAVAEGVDGISLDAVKRQAAWSRRSDFAQLWDRINGRRTGCDWQSNPWVWAVTFRRTGEVT